MDINEILEGVARIETKLEYMAKDITDIKGNDKEQWDKIRELDNKVGKAYTIAGVVSALWGIAIATFSVGLRWFK